MDISYLQTTSLFRKIAPDLFSFAPSNTTFNQIIFLIVKIKCTTQFHKLSRQTLKDLYQKVQIRQVIYN